MYSSRCALLFQPYRSVVLLVLCALVQLACGLPALSPVITPTLTLETQQSTITTPTRSPTVTATITPSITPSPSLTPTLTAITPTPTQTLTPTPLLLALEGTALPQVFAAISLGNAGKVSELVQWSEATVTDLDWAPDGKTLAVASYDSISLYEIQTRTKLQSLEAGEGIVNVAFSPDGAWLASGHRTGSKEMGYESSIQLWRGPDWQPLGILYWDTRALSSVTFLPSGSFVTAYSSREDQFNVVEFRNTHTWEITRTLQTGFDLNVIFSPGEALMASVPDRYAVKVWDLEERKLLYTLHTSFTGAVSGLVFSPGGELLASGHYDGAIRLWDVNSGELLATLNTEGVVESLAFSPDSSILASGESYEDGAIRLWEVESGQLLRTLTGHTHAVENLIFSPDGGLLVSGSYDGTLRVWGVRP